MLKIGRSGQQLAAVALALTLVAVVLYGPNAIHGGFISDAWSNRAIYAFAPKPGFFAGITQYMAQPNIAVRPLLAVYLSALNAVFGGHMGVWLGWLIAANVAMCLSLYLLLRRLTLAAIDAAAISVLVLVFPVSGSLRLWAALVASPVTITLSLLGFLLALIALEDNNRGRGLALHGVSLLLFAASVLLYELMLPVMLLSVLVYRLRVGWRPAIYRWLIDCAVLLTLALTVTSSSESGFKQSTGGMISHAGEIYDQARILLATAVLPFSAAHWYLLLLAALVPAAGVVVYRLLPSDTALRLELRRWLTVMAAGAIVVVASYAVFIPGMDYYVPLEPGIGNRVNAVPSIGWILLLYGGARTVGALVFRDTPRSRTLAQGFAILGCALLAIGWVKTLRAESHSYTNAFLEDERVLNVTQGAIPRPRTEGTIWTFGQPVQIAPGIPIFGNTWDMTTAIQLRYDDPTLKSYVAYPGTLFNCLPQAVEPGGAYQEGEQTWNSALRSPYGRTYFIDTGSGRAVRIGSQEECRRAASSFVPSPELPAS